MLWDDPNLVGYQYKLVKSTTAAAIDTYEEINAISGADLILDWDAATNHHAPLLKSNTTYYFAVIAKNGDDKVIFLPASLKTTEIESIAIQALANDNLLMAYRDKEDSSKGKTVIFTKAGAYVSGPNTFINQMGTSWKSSWETLLTDSNDVLIALTYTNSGHHITAFSVELPANCSAACMISLPITTTSALR